MQDEEGKGLFIITNFNKLNIAFHVDQVIGIHRVYWSEIIKPDATINVQDKGVSTGVIKLDGQLIVILDFEKIISDISPETGLKVSDVEHLENRNRNNTMYFIFYIAGFLISTKLVPCFLSVRIDIQVGITCFLQTICNQFT